MEITFASTTYARKSLSAIPVKVSDTSQAILNWQYGDIVSRDDWIPENIYREIIALLPVVCVDTLVVHDGRALLTRRRQEPQAGDLWIQGGRLRKGEGLEDAALRTAEQESGLRLALREPLGTFSTTFDTSAHGQATTHTVNVTFLAHVVGDAAPQPDEAHVDFVWWQLDEPTGNPYLDQLFALARQQLEEWSKR